MSGIDKNKLRFVGCAVLAALFLTAPLAAQAEPDYKYCELAGLAFGAKKELIGSVAARLVSRQGLDGESGCVAVWSDAFSKGERLSALGLGWSRLDVVTWGKLQSFEESVVDSIVDGMKFRTEQGK
jgi:hypothetical protein